MTPNINPYQSPAEIEETETNAVSDTRQIDYTAFSLWPFVFALNLIVPVMIGWDMTRNHGRIGVGVAIFLFLIAGWVLCYFRPMFARHMIVGSFFISLTQLFPVIQVTAGMAAIVIAQTLHLGVEQGPIYSYSYDSISELGGFVVTMLVGGMLLSFTAVLVFLAGLIGARARSQCKT